MYNPRCTQAEPSFREPLADPGTEPLSGPLVCISVSKSWLAILAGCALQVCQPTSWAETDPVLLHDLLDRSYALFLAIALAEECVPIQQRFQDCTLQTSDDGGTTWTAVPGWAENFSRCVSGIIGPHVGAIVMTDGLSSPPVPIWNEAGTDWVYAG